MLINPGSHKVTNSREYITQRICKVGSYEFSNELSVRLLKEHFFFQSPLVIVSDFRASLGFLFRLLGGEVCFWN